MAAVPLAAAQKRKEDKAMADSAANIVELRQYTLRGGQRDTLIRLFERAFVAPQAAARAPVLGTYRDIDDPDRFVWLRGFEGMVERGTALRTFYGGSVWRAHRDAANATMIDSDNVLLLRRRSGSAAALAAPALVTATIHYLGSTAPEAFARFFEDHLAPLLVADGARPVWTLESETGPNSFPPLPVREGEPVLVWFAAWRTRSDLDRFERRWASRSGWRDSASVDLLPALMRKPERIRLVPASA
ncbi:NIPSNAP family protein [Sphingomonas deserti]|uniref:NIPSNAP family protein n=2 Tax=Allosphingosinicella deserti TaxID=2116704 RepID=A0A2P7QKU3_9SPHN|nr:NIPSNAP family protein [Sphingomonas deserti]